MPFFLRETIVEEVKKIIDLDVKEPSDSNYCSNIVIVKKPDGSNRFCIDFRTLNRITVFDCEPIPKKRFLLKYQNQNSFQGSI